MNPDEQPQCGAYDNYLHRCTLPEGHEPSWSHVAVLADEKHNIVYQRQWTEENAEWRENERQKEYGTRVGSYLRAKQDAHDVKFTLDMSAVLRDVYAMEEKAFRVAVVGRLRELGYTVIEPEETA